MIPSSTSTLRRLNPKCYLTMIQLLVKAYPQLNDKIVFLGFLQSCSKYQDMKAPKQEFENRDMQYLMADQAGNITCVTEGLN
jgi:hypothetical protein